jgi:hypothetical protein
VFVTVVPDEEVVWKCMADCIQVLGLLALLVRKDKNVHSVSICNVLSVSISSLATPRSSVFFSWYKITNTDAAHAAVCVPLTLRTYADVC